ncbi:MAG TPA: hypothetical protein VHP11_06300, partial [Tepidisphaeraceae bacterium]|nr:hypothetical protein [Tepidisphaeraceae bacterium]
ELNLQLTGIQQFNDHAVLARGRVMGGSCDSGPATAALVQVALTAQIIDGLPDRGQRDAENTAEFGEGGQLCPGEQLSGNDGLLDLLKDLVV